MEDLIKKIFIFIFVLIFIITLVNIIFKFVPLPINPVRLVSTNMEPTYSKGDVLFYIKLDNFNVDDIIIHKTDRSTIVGRIIELNEDGTYKAKGDNNPESYSQIGETSINKKNVIGKVLFGVNGIIFYIISYATYIIIASFITNLIYLKIKRG